jgi:hypothetical protein
VRDTAVVLHGDLAVEDEGRQLGGGERVERCVEERGAVAAVARGEVQGFAVEAGDEAVAVVLDFMQPIAVWRLGARGGELRSDVGREGGPDRPGGAKNFDIGGDWEIACGPPSANPSGVYSLRNFSETVGWQLVIP